MTQECRFAFPVKRGRIPYIDEQRSVSPEIPYEQLQATVPHLPGPTDSNDLDTSFNTSATQEAAPNTSPSSGNRHLPPSSPSQGVEHSSTLPSEAVSRITPHGRRTHSMDHRTYSNHIDGQPSEATSSNNLMDDPIFAPISRTPNQQVSRQRRTPPGSWLLVGQPQGKGQFDRHYIQLERSFVNGLKKGSLYWTEDGQIRPSNPHDDGDDGTPFWSHELHDLPHRH